METLQEIKGRHKKDEQTIQEYERKEKVKAVRKELEDRALDQLKSGNMKQLGYMELADIVYYYLFEELLNAEDGQGFINKMLEARGSITNLKNGLSDMNFAIMTTQDKLVLCSALRIPVEGEEGAENPILLDAMIEKAKKDVAKHNSGEQALGKQRDTNTETQKAKASRPRRDYIVRKAKGKA